MDNAVLEKSFKFAVRMVDAYRYLTSQKKEYIISDQLLRSGTSVGAMVREAKYAQSPRDFINKFSIGLKEANETDYWLELLYKTGYIDRQAYESAHNECRELISIMASIVLTSKQKLKSKNTSGAKSDTPHPTS